MQTYIGNACWLREQNWHPCLLNFQFGMKISRDSNGKPDLSAGNAIGISKKKHILALDCTGGQCYFNTLEVFDREQRMICHLNTTNLLLYQGTFFYLYTSKHICTQWMKVLRISIDQKSRYLEIWLRESQ